MPFTIDETTLLIKGRKGDSASFTFDFNQDMSAYNIEFFVKKNPSSTTAIIEKIYENPSTEAVTVELLPAETDLLTSKPNSYETYYWGLVVSIGTTFRQTVIPTLFNTAPQMYIYPEIGD